MRNPLRYKLLISYDGTDYSGWQIQPNASSIQEEIEKALATYLRQPVRLIGSGRTDAGVHALGQVAHFKWEEAIDLSQAFFALNGLLPPSIRINEIEKVEETFHAQYSAKGKIYHYHIWTTRPLSPIYRRYHTYFPYPLSLPLLKEAAKCFIGTHDFTTFANVGSCVKTAVRHLSRIDCIEQEGGFRLEFEGSGFLYKMVRNITGILLEVGTEKRRIEEIPSLFAAKDRRKIGMAAPATGLFLKQVLYPTPQELEHEQTSSQS
ncbi:MAG: tRNA pseudouridine synthase A [Chlamydiales bacterium]|nr:tRNA pseudouridine synthase A [Chlamydiales bacterium]MCH9619355.1 tRNA pseudouridine synthase A [Chlamydiales bacterium]MCH9622159.1 tRNA pseudouridine synthase A [Chlamydiales bacterium]